MKKLLLLLVLVLSVTVPAGAETLRVGMTCDYAPYNWTQAEASDMAVPLAAGGYADGYDVQIALLIAKELGMDLKIVKTEWDSLPMALTSGKIDAIITGMSPTAELKMVIDFTDPYYESDLVMVVMKSSPYAEATSLDDLAGARITGQLNTFHYTVIDQIPGVIKETALETFPAMIVALASGRIDGCISERPVAISAVASNPDFTITAFDEEAGFITNEEDTTVAVGLRKDSPLLEQINLVLAGLDRVSRLAMMDEAIARQPLAEE